MQFENHRRTALQYPLFIGPYSSANNMALLAWRPSQGTKLYCLVNRGIRCEQLAQGCWPNNAVVGVRPATSWSRANALPLHYRVTRIRCCSAIRWATLGEWTMTHSNFSLLHFCLKNTAKVLIDVHCTGPMPCSYQRPKALLACFIWYVCFTIIFIQPRWTLA